MAMTNYRQQLGLKGERLALEFLLSLGCLLVEQRFRIQEGEADLIVLDHKQLVFVEVKTRTSLNGRFGAPIESITPQKVRRMQRVALHFLDGYNRIVDFRIDVIGLTLAPDGALINLQHLRDITP